MIRMTAGLGTGVLTLGLAACAGPSTLGTGAPGTGPYGRGDALVPGTGYHATGDIPCSMGGGQPTGSCPFGVKREGNGSGTVTLTKPDGRTRAIFFTNGRATGADTSEADPGRFSASRRGDLSVVRIGQERYEIPDAVVFGG
jgi:hypothetical protein